MPTNNQRRLDFFNALYLWTISITAVAGAVSAVVTYQISQYTQRVTDERKAESDDKDRALASYQIDASLRIADAEQKAREASERAEFARLEQERLKATLAWRTLSPENQSQIGSNLLTSSGSVTIAYIQNDPESLAYAISIERAFTYANSIASPTKWSVKPEPRVYATSILYGMYISGPNALLVQATRRAFSAAHINFLSDETPNPGVQIGLSMSLGPVPLTTDVLIMVGSKTPPF